jgi:ABC-2 type transport system ATP-binding protein
VTVPAVEIRGLRVRRRDALVFNGLDLDVRASVVTGLIGPSGGGKSTLMRAIVGVQRVEQGSVRVFGLDAGTLAARRITGYMTQSLSVYDDLTVAENLAYFASAAGAGQADAARVIDVVGLPAERSALVRKLSGGQRARVSLAAALLGRPRLLVLDEPTVGLDPLLRAELWTTFRSLAAEGASLLVSSHVMDEAERCDELVLVREGAVLAAEPPARLVSRMSARSVEDAFLKLVRQRGPL